MKRKGDRYVCTCTTAGRLGCQSHEPVDASFNRELGYPHGTCTCTCHSQYEDDPENWTPISLSIPDYRGTGLASEIADTEVWEQVYEDAVTLAGELPVGAPDLSDRELKAVRDITEEEDEKTRWFNRLYQGHWINE